MKKHTSLEICTRLSYTLLFIAFILLIIGFIKEGLSFSLYAGIGFGVMLGGMLVFGIGLVFALTDGGKEKGD
ncbi:hypothetical protein IMZ31_18865 (plasmid) [Pontibacillus sp. ALD_SL1]|uniref:hypothetical protein n=1 Tax=Pontibacillus sp. ALD_SL1 TaxID=2777185 RepID=UPI001A96DEDF|nr:hypothetical protein [Pontibacillus sp. ALD_SL1]QST02611.1 hypothetical protein IMZ31_18865 [Pontibacillus sp. ALD_SL1]